MPEIDDDDDVDDDDDELIIFPLTDLNGDSGNSSEAERYACEYSLIFYYNENVYRISYIFVDHILGII